MAKPKVKAKSRTRVKRSPFLIEKISNKKIVVKQHNGIITTVKTQKAALAFVQFLTKGGAFDGEFPRFFLRP